MPDTTVPPTETRQQLHSIVRKEVPFDRKAREVLEVGVVYLDVDYGYLTRVDTETGTREVTITTDSKKYPAGRQFGLENTYCRETIQTETHFALHDASTQVCADDPAFETGGNQTYLGIPLIVDEELFGTVCFVAQEPRSEPFSDVETWFVEHLSGLLERELARDQVETELTNQTNFATVLNRVLRHNLRNDISVIRGYTEVMADQLNDESTAETVLSHIDDLIEISQKARELEQIITASSDRRRTKIGALTEKVVETVAQDYPAASLSVEYDSEVHVAVMENFDRAVEELIENAVEHSGDSPSVTVVIETVPNAIEIRIRDDGPGLPDNEAEVLTPGEASPLAHGSGLGLWLAYWIVTSHDGSIDPAVTENGTTMTISLPRKPLVGTQGQLTELSRSRDKYKSTFDEAHDAMVITDDDGRYIEVNKSAADLFGLSERELLGRTISEFVPENFDFDEKWQQFQTSADKRGVFPLVCPDGSERIVEYAATPDIVPGEHLSVLRDITERTEREQKLGELKERYETLLEAAPDPVFVADAESGEILETNTAAETLLGRAREDIVGQHQSTLHPPDQTDLYQQLYEEHVQSEGVRRHLSDGSPIYMMTEDGEQIPVEISVGTVSLSGGPVAFGIFRDITERKEHEQWLRKLKDRVELAIDAGDIGVWEWEIDSDIIHWNESMERLLGMEPNTFPGTWDAFIERVHPDDLDHIESEIESALVTADETTYSMRMETAGGEYCWIETRLRVVTDANGQPVRVVGVGIKITDRVENRPNKA
jgi:PAS domain S-box-containing protein